MFQFLLHSRLSNTTLIKSQLWIDKILQCTHALSVPLVSIILQLLVRWLANPATPWSITITRLESMSARIRNFGFPLTGPDAWDPIGPSLSLSSCPKGCQSQGWSPCPPPRLPHPDHPVGGLIDYCVPWWLLLGPLPTSKISTASLTGLVPKILGSPSAQHNWPHIWYSQSICLALLARLVMALRANM